MSDTGWGPWDELEGSCLSRTTESTVPLMLATGMQSPGGQASGVDFRMQAAKKQHHYVD